MSKLTRLLIILTYVLFLPGCSDKDISRGVHAEPQGNEVQANKINGKTSAGREDETKLKIIIRGNGKTVIFELNKSTAAKSLYEQLPMTVDVENYSNNEKIFYPEKKLDTSVTPLANAKKGTLAYYAPWGDVVLFYVDFGSASGLYELGKAVSGIDDIVSLSGKIQIEKEN